MPAVPGDAETLLGHRAEHPATAPCSRNPAPSDFPRTGGCADAPRSLHVQPGWFASVFSQRKAGEQQLQKLLVKNKKPVA